MKSKGQMQCITLKLNKKDLGINKEMQKVNGKDYGGVKDLIKVKDDNIDSRRGREKEKALIVKRVFLKIQRDLKNNASIVKSKSTKIIPLSKNTRASTSLGKSLKKKLRRSTTTIKKTMREKKGEKKVYLLPGQKHDPPEDRDPLRIFYSSLREQIPESRMAEFWLMEYGLLSKDEAKKALVRKQRWSQSLKHGNLRKSYTLSQLPNKSQVTIKKSLHFFNDKGKDVGTSSKGKKKRLDSESDSDDFLNIRIRRKF